MDSELNGIYGSSIIKNNVDIYNAIPYPFHNMPFSVNQSPQGRHQMAKVTSDFASRRKFIDGAVGKDEAGPSGIAGEGDHASTSAASFGKSFEEQIKPVPSRSDDASPLVIKSHPEALSR